MKLSDVRDYVASLGMSEYVYMGKMDPKPEKAFGIYNSKRQKDYKTAIGGTFLESYGTKYVTILIHWSKSPRETEEAAEKLFRALMETREETINEAKIKFIQPLYEIQDVGTDNSGVYEMVIEAAVIYEKKEGKRE